MAEKRGASEAHVHIHHHHHGAAAAPKRESAMKRREDEVKGGRKANATLRRERKEGKKV